MTSRSRALDGLGRHRTAITIVGSAVAAGILAVVLEGHRDEFATALASASVWVLLVATVLLIAALLARSEAWNGCVTAAGGRVDRRVLYRASGIGYLGSLVNAHLGVASRIAALRASAPGGVPPRFRRSWPPSSRSSRSRAMLAALTSFTLVGPLGLPWWLPLVAFAVMGALSTGLRHLCRAHGPSAGTAGGRFFAIWAGADRLWTGKSPMPRRARPSRRSDARRTSSSATSGW